MLSWYDFIFILQLLFLPLYLYFFTLKILLRHDATKPVGKITDFK